MLYAIPVTEKGLIVFTTHRPALIQSNDNGIHCFCLQTLQVESSVS